MDCTIYLVKTKALISCTVIHYTRMDKTLSKRPNTDIPYASERFCKIGMTSGQSLSFLSDHGYFCIFCFCILVFLAVEMKFKPTTCMLGTRMDTFFS